MTDISSRGPGCRYRGEFPLGETSPFHRFYVPAVDVCLFLVMSSLFPFIVQIFFEKLAKTYLVFCFSAARHLDCLFMLMEPTAIGNSLHTYSAIRKCTFGFLYIVGTLYCSNKIAVR